ncbi:MAG: D-alanine--D-alanine ligase [Alphaproteobacteria bacterium]
MRVGITYDLRDVYLAEGWSEEETAEFDSPVTIDGIESVLAARGWTVDRIGHVRTLAARLVAGERWDLVFNIAEGMHGPGREAQVPALLDAWRVPYTFSDPMVLALTLDKGMTKRVVRDAGVPTADFAVVGEEADLAAVRLPFPLFVKPVAEGTGKGVTAASRVGTAEALAAACRRTIARYGQPALVETFLPGREFTVGIVGTGRAAEAVGAMEILFGPTAEAHGYSFDNKERYEGRIDYRLAEDDEARRAVEVALAAWRVLGCRDGGRIDLRSDAAGRPHFIEVNPLAGINPEKSDLVILARLAGWSYDRLLGRILDSCLARIGAGARAAA